MAIEIERKFLLADGSWRAAAGPGRTIRQGYCNTAPELTLRVRIYGGEAFLTVKGRSDTAARSEFEYPIPVADAEAMLAEFCAGKIVTKVRHLVPFGDKVWEVDIFDGDNAGLEVAELELASLDEPFDLPPWIGPEVTADRRYSNGSLARNPYRNWK